MLRKEWKFRYPATQVAAAAGDKLAQHDERIGFWREQQTTVMTAIRSEGIEVSEKMALSLGNPKARDWERGGDIMIRNDLRKSLAETFEKLAYHTERRDTYDGWVQVLRAQGDAPLELDIDDWLFFFGRDTE